MLTRTSPDDVLKQAALGALAVTGSPSALDSLLTASRPEQPARVRREALRGLATFAENAKPDETVSRQIVQVLLSAAEAGTLLSRFVAIESLGRLGAGASPALPVLDRLAREDESVRDTARTSAERIRKQGKAAASDMEALRAELERVRKERDQLKEQLQRTERRRRAG